MSSTRRRRPRRSRASRSANCSRPTRASPRISTRRRFRSSSTRPPTPASAPKWRARRRRAAGVSPPNWRGRAPLADLPADGFAAAEFIIRHLYRPVELTDGGRCFAATETEHPIDGDIWFWTDDNGKIVEFLSRPELWQRFRDEIGDVLRFLR